MKNTFKLIAASAALLCASAALAQKGETVKIAWLDPLSGLMAAVGTNQLKTYQLIAEDFNKKNTSGVKFEIIGIDNKLSPQETTSALRSAMDQGARYVTQGNGSGPALAIISTGKSVLSTNSQSTATEYRVTMSVIVQMYDAQKNQLLVPTRLSTSRNLIIGAGYATAEDVEYERLYTDMAQELANSIAYRIRAVWFTRTQQK